jgi:hypothetical protein
MGFLARTPSNVDPPYAARLTRDSEPERDPPRVDLSSLTREQLKTLLGNLQSRDQQSLIALVESELFRRSGPSHVGEVPSGSFEASPSSSDEAPEPARLRSKPRLLVAALALGTVAGLVFSLWGFREQGGRELQVASVGRSEVRPAAPLAADAAVFGSTPASPSTAAKPALKQATAMMHARAPSNSPPRAIHERAQERPRELARLQDLAPTAAVQTRAMVATVDVEPAPMSIAELDAPTASRKAGPGAPLIVSRGAAASLLGPPSSRPTGLTGLQSGNPLRMATAVTSPSR